MPLIGAEQTTSSLVVMIKAHCCCCIVRSCVVYMPLILKIVHPDMSSYSILRLLQYTPLRPVI